MRKKIISICLLVVLLSCCFGFGGCGSDENEIGQHTEGSNDSEYEGEGGGNPDKGKESDVKVIAILVNEGEYIYKNKPIELDDIVDMVEEIDEKFYVEISDNNATYRAYSELVEALEELEITVEEK